MVVKRSLGPLCMALFVSLAACWSNADDDAEDDTANLTETQFNKDSLLPDAVLRDSDSLTADDIDRFLEKTPWGHPSALATYREGGQTVGQMMYDAARKYDINPLELLVRVQMEQGLVAKQKATAHEISIAFGCGCPHSPLCGPKYEGFGAQCECAAGTLRRSFDRATSKEGTAGGWKKGVPKLSADKITVTPDNSATAALYTYTPWVGEAGGGKPGIGGASLHHDVWYRFANDLGYPKGSTDGGTSPGGSGNRDASTEGGSSGSDRSSSGTPGSSGSPSSSGSSGNDGSSGSSGTSGGTSSGSNTTTSGSSGTSTSSSGSSGNDLSTTSSSSGATSSGAGTSSGTTSSSGSSGNDGSSGNTSSSGSSGAGSSSGASSGSSGAYGSSSGGSSSGSSGANGVPKFDNPSYPTYPSAPSGSSTSTTPSRNDPGGTDTLGIEPDDNTILKDGNAPPTDNSPPLTSKEQSELSQKKSTHKQNVSNSGCSTSGMPHRAETPIGLSLALALVLAGRRRRLARDNRRRMG